MAKINYIIGLIAVLLFFQFTENSFSQNRFIFISDTQEPLSVEKIFIKTNNNGLASDAIFNAVQSAPQPLSVFHLGDLTALGFSKDGWEKIDRFTAKLKERKIPFYPIMGNHEYMLWANRGKNEFVKRFGLQYSKWYSVKIAGCAIVMLNSNFSNLTKAENTLQENWYKNKIDELQKDSSVQTIIVCLHHSPYTNSKVVEPAEQVQEKIVPLFLKSSKCKLFVSGHAHTFEHFKIKGKDFLVTGGGGGALQPMLTGGKQRFNNIFLHKNETGFFHYLDCEFKSDKLFITVKKLNDDFKTFSDVYTLTID